MIVFVWVTLGEPLERPKIIVFTAVSVIVIARRDVARRIAFFIALPVGRAPIRTIMFIDDLDAVSVIVITRRDVARRIAFFIALPVGMAPIRAILFINNFDAKLPPFSFKAIIRRPRNRRTGKLTHRWPPLKVARVLLPVDRQVIIIALGGKVAPYNIRPDRPRDVARIVTGVVVVSRADAIVVA
jgi:hypothetical protein